MYENRTKRGFRACTQPGEQRGLLGLVARAGTGDWVLVAQNTEEAAVELYPQAYQQRRYHTYAALAQLTPAQIKAIVNPSRAGNFIDAEGWIAQAQLLVQGK